LIKSDTALHLYTLIVRKDLSYEILIDGKSEKSGKLDGATDFEPPLLPKAEVDDPDETKPKDWVEEEKIKDPEASKPDDWDEDAPAEVPDMDAEKPAGWLDDETADIADPSAEMPEDWDEDEDGEWEAPTIANAKCASAPGCGEWVRPLKTNPEYKGKWSAPMIANPAYKGVWAPQKITNPGFFEADHPTAKAPLAPIGAVAVEVWTMSKGFHFDNIVVANDVAAAQAFADATFGVKVNDSIQ
jgi:calnexin